MTHAEKLDYSLLAAAAEARWMRESPVIPRSYKGVSAVAEIELQAIAAVEAAMPHPCFPELDREPEPVLEEV
jgi:hypothetical protein